MAIDDAQGPRNSDKHYLDVCQDYYKALWKKGINVNVIDETCSLDNYKAVIAPMTYMLRKDFASKVDNFVKNGGTYLSTFWSGIVDDTDLCFLGGFPGPLSEVLGIWDEEIECLDDNENIIVKGAAPVFDEHKLYTGSLLCSVVHAKNAKILATFKNDFIKNYPALTVNNYGNGKAYYVASRMDENFIYTLIEELLNNAGVKSEVKPLPYGVSCHTRYNDKHEYVFIENYSDNSVTVN